MQMEFREILCCLLLLLLFVVAFVFSVSLLLVAVCCCFWLRYELHSFSLKFFPLSFLSPFLPLLLRFLFASTFLVLVVLVPCPEIIKTTIE